MGKQVKTVRLPPEKAEEIEQAVEQGEYPNESEAIRQQLNGDDTLTPLHRFVNRLADSFALAGTFLVVATSFLPMQLHMYFFTPIFGAIALYAVERVVLRRHEPAVSEWLSNRIPQSLRGD